jgi:dTMP kinase
VARARGSASGLFITFEGIEGSGKTTQARILARRLRKDGYRVLLTREPGGPPVSEKIRRILLDSGNQEMHSLTELLLYEASRAQHTRQWVIPALRKGEVVISDRYADASVGYQGGGRRIPLRTVRALNHIATGGIVPNLTFVVDYPPAAGLGRASCGRLDRIEKETLSFHRRVAKAYRALARAEPRRVRLVDGRGGKAEIARRIWRHVEAMLSGSDSSSLRTGR